MVVDVEAAPTVAESRRRVAKKIVSGGWTPQNMNAGRWQAVRDLAAAYAELVDGPTFRAPPARATSKKPPPKKGTAI